MNLGLPRVRGSAALSASAAALLALSPVLAQVDTSATGQPPAKTQPTPKPAAPSAATGGEVDPKAKALLADASAAIKAIKGITFKSKRELLGTPSLQMGSSGEVRFVRNAATPSASPFWAKGSMTRPLANDTVALEAAFNGTIAGWIDEAKKEVVEQQVSAADAARRVKTARDQLMPSIFFDSEPLLAEMGGQVLKVDAPVEIGGVKCDVVRVMNPATQRETRISIAQGDKLPRRIEQITPSTGGTTATFYIEMTDVKPADLKPAEFAVAVPAGYTKRLETGPQPKLPTNPQPPADTKTPNTPPAPPTVPKGGLDAGVSAPAWSLKKADGSGSAALADQKGKVVVLGFWAPVIGSSTGTLSVLEAAKKDAGGSDVSFFGVACRAMPGDAGGAAAKTAFADAKATYPLLLEGDAAAADYKVRGFPSVAVIGPDGKVAAFFESTPTADALKAAIAAAKGK